MDDERKKLVDVRVSAAAALVAVTYDSRNADAWVKARNAWSMAEYELSEYDREHPPTAQRAAKARTVKP